MGEDERDIAVLFECLNITSLPDITNFEDLDYSNCSFKYYNPDPLKAPAGEIGEVTRNLDRSEVFSFSMEGSALHSTRDHEHLWQLSDHSCLVQVQADA